MTTYIDQFLHFLPVLIAVGAFIGLGLLFIWMGKEENKPDSIEDMKIQSKQT